MRKWQLRWVLAWSSVLCKQYDPLEEEDETES